MKRYPRQGNRLNKSGAIGGVAEGNTEFSDCRVDALVEAYEGIRWPESEMQLFSRNYFTGVFQEYSQHSKGLFLQGNSSAFLMDLDCAEVDFEESGANTTAGTGRRVHKATPGKMISTHKSSSANSITLWEAVAYEVRR